VNHGPVADKTHYDTVLKYIDISKRSGKIVLGSDQDPSQKSKIVNPVIFTDQPEDSQIMKEEVFDPVVIINTFKTEHEVITKANDSEFGLYAALYTNDLSRAPRVSKKLESGR
jgi:aldehyde dehydrogenase (NAD+)